ncbi:hypothetical protein ELUMI_v1c03830 [Williamsoniiplasma luminosum]|uniref:Amino acid permease n=1 Tax=Williamsoniiplasma luminosum TaxID=214888 RepID=A0A2K8NVB1_9MOLU|nr:APC family permease [Williamsoniiplasma luminosum]ATZ17108.1 hypothetical protein ELUMI_v1c03830 [Williamsoniiplasma luminosum]
MDKKEKIKNMLMFKRKPDSGEEKIGLKQMIWLGFDYTVSMSFVLILTNAFSGEKGVGYHLFWIILLGAFVAGIAGMAFAKCANIFSSKSGGPFEYSRRTFGHFGGWMIGIYQYILLPISASANLLVLLSIALEGLYSTTMWGTVEQTQLYLNLISIGIYVVIALTVLLGTKIFKLATNVTSIVKWAVMVMVYIGAIIIMARTSGGKFNEAQNAGSLTLGNFNTAFTAFFYAFTGFETFSTIGENVKNPKKTIPKTIMIVLGIAVVFYMVGLVFFIGALGSVFPKNPNNEIIQMVMGTGALVFVGISLIAQNLNNFMQGTYYSGGALQPLAQHKMISAKLAAKDKTGLAIRAIFINIIFTVLFATIWLVLPFILKDNSVDFATIVGFKSVVLFIIYGTVIVIALWLSIKKKTKTNLVLMVLWVFGLVFFIYQSVVYFVDWDAHKWQTLTFIVVTALAIGWYFVGIYPKYKKRIASGELKKESINDLPNWLDSEEFLELSTLKAKQLEMKMRSLKDGSDGISTPRLILQNKVKNKYKKADVKLDISAWTKIELLNKLNE